MDLEIVILSEVSQIKRNIVDILCTWNLKKMTEMNLFTNSKQTDRLRELTVTSGKGCREGIVRESAININTCYI